MFVDCTPSPFSPVDERRFYCILYRGYFYVAIEYGNASYCRNTVAAGIFNFKLYTVYNHAPCAVESVATAAAERKVSSTVEYKVACNG